MYWCHSDGGGKYSVKYGIIEEQYNPTEVFVQFLAPRESRLVNGISINKFESNGKYKKLPNGWTYNTDLYELTWEPLTEEEKNVLALTQEVYNKFEAAMDDDFNTADAISSVFELVKLANTNSNVNSSKAFLEEMKTKITNLTDVLGLEVVKENEMLDEEIDSLIAERQQARKDKDFKRADEIRDLLLEKGIILEDTREGVRWKRA